MSIRGNGHSNNGDMIAWLKKNYEELRELTREIRADIRRQDARIAMLEDRAEVHRKDIDENRRLSREIISEIARLDAQRDRQLEAHLQALKDLNVHVTRVEKKR